MRVKRDKKPVPDAKLQSLRVANLTVFDSAEFQFSPQLNVIVGENATGKSHLLKVAYSVLAASAEEGRKPGSSAPTKALLQTMLAKKLVAVMRPESLGRLARRSQGRERCELKCSFSDARLNIDFNFSTMSKTEVVVERAPAAWVKDAAVFLPTRELMTIYPGFIPLYDSYYVEFEETWLDTCLLLGSPLVRGPREKRAAELLAPLEAAMGGKVVLDQGRFYLTIPGQGHMEMPLVAEGIRKLAMLARLIATGSLLDKGYLFWDEPEANLNPALIKHIAGAILHVCQNGVQVFIATHSLFLIRELDILLRSDVNKGGISRFFGLHRGADGVTVQQGDTVDDIGSITSLNEELSQSDRYLEAEG